jgi:hypothetical protein
MTRIAHNKGKYGAKKMAFIETGIVECIRHGQHSNWFYSEKHKQLSCRYCLSERQSAYKQQDEYIFKKFIIYTKSRVKKCNKKLEHNITLEYIAKLYVDQDGNCAISGLPLDEAVMSLDRIDSSLGYIEGNVQWVHFDINRMKSDFEQDYFIYLCKSVSSKGK